MTPSPMPQTNVAARRRAFSLMELMVAIVILGLGLVMVATIFPVAWGRARDLSEFNLHRNIADNAHATFLALTRVPGPLNTDLDAFGQLQAGLKGNLISFSGDLIYEPETRTYYRQRDAWPNEPWVHALNMENIQIDPRQLVSDEPWKTEQGLDLEAAAAGALHPDIVARCYQHEQVAVHQRFYTPFRARQNVAASGTFTGADIAWDEMVDARTHGWSAFYRIRERIPPFFPPSGLSGAPLAAATAQYYEAAASQSRVLDVFYVSHRRTQPTFRYARQDPATAPDPYDLEPPTVVTPQALESAQDVLLPVAWRVQIQLPPVLNSRESTNPALKPTGIPTEIDVPPSSTGGDMQENTIWVEMFPSGARFIDEVSGQVFQVVSRRLTSDDGDQAVLTLDREFLLEDANLAEDDPRCASSFCALNALEAGEQIRTVWVFPPPVEAGDRDDGDPIVFAGKHPVIDIDVRSVTMAPPR